ncbi:MAG: methionine--tRNA ligase [Gemmatimonadales bacterium]
MGKFYLTTAIDYSNGDPHLGHALEKIGADAIARYRRLRGDQVHFLMGMDENSQGVLPMAEKNRITPAEWVEQLAERFANYWQRLECSNDAWIRTTEPRHVDAVNELLRRMLERSPDDIYLADYEGLYCTGCEEFKSESQITDGKCAEHPTLALVPTKERNHFFRLSAYTDRLLAMITSGQLVVEPEIRRNEILRLLESGLQDISISRSRLPWGIPFPDSPGHTVYVWFDAVINYLAATGFPAAGYDRLWPADLHVIGKGITRFHCVLWPAMCLSAGIAPPRMVWAHGYVQWLGAKMSKTAGTAVNLDDAINRHGPDALRYFLMREVGFEADGDFTWDRFDARYTADLADGFGNLVARSIAMIEKYRAGVVPAGAPTELDRAATERFLPSYQSAMDRYDLRGATEAFGALAATADGFVAQSAPWALAKADRAAELDVVLAALARTLYRLTVLAAPFLPGKAAEVWAALGQSGGVDATAWKQLGSPPIEGRTVHRPAILFPKSATPK